MDESQWCFCQTEQATQATVHPMIPFIWDLEKMHNSGGGGALMGWSKTGCFGEMESYVLIMVPMW